MAENRILRKALYMNLETTRLRGRPRNRWKDEVRKDGRLVGGKRWKKRVCIQLPPGFNPIAVKYYYYYYYYYY
jgi:hypothetical protein